MEQQRRGAGRPPGSPNKPTILKRYEATFDKVKDMMTPESRKHYEDMFAGKVEVDPIAVAEFFTLLMTLLTTATVNDAIETKTLTQDSVQMTAQYRMLLKDLDDMQRRRETERAKVKNNDVLVDPTRESDVDSVEGIFTRIAQGQNRR
jgi:hypothetical protein